MAARAWVTAVVALFGIWIAMSFLAQLTGFFIGLQDYLYDSASENGLLIPDSWRQISDKINGYFESVWSWVPVVVFGSIIIYILIESMRRRPEEVYFD